MKYIAGNDIFIDGDTFVIFKKERVLFRNNDYFEFDIFSRAEKLEDKKYYNLFNKRFKKFYNEIS